ncbi:hypothetical protein [Alicyclobacillus sp. SO9]|uniref:hypothetical protein n=1 Tax=Alicyclobacillus sp. SO9 TaxID=2665646 RepID=UPI0018E8C236|nr:hypothetical protein [Alicyclobacillus sp. SO9]QQE80881.1 hypothetical protein GI364_11150 [Alicyclobacillus sp. SO9]
MADKLLEMMFESVKDLTSAVASMRREINTGFQEVNRRLDHVEERLTRLEQDSDLAKIKLFNMERDFGRGETHG